MLYPRRGVSELTRFTPEEMLGQVRPDAAAVPGLRGTARRPLRQPARHPRRGGEDRRQVDPRVRQPHRARGPGRRGPRQDRRRAARSPAPRADEPAAHRARPGGARSTSIRLTDLQAQPYDREAVHRIFDDLQFRVLRERLLEIFEQADETSTEGFEVAGARLAPGTVRAWLDEHAHESRVGLVVRGTLGPGRWGRAPAGVRGGGRRGRGGRRRGLSPDDDAALAAWLADPTPTKVGHDLKAAINALTRPGLAGRRRPVGHDPRRLPGAARPAHVRPRRSGPALPAPHARPRPVDSRRPAVAAARTTPSERNRRPRRGPRRPRHGAGARRHRPARRRWRRTSRILGQLSLLADMELPVMTVLGIMERDGIAVDIPYLEDLQSTFAAEANAAAKARLRADRPRGQPRLAQAAAGGAVRRAGHAEDQADQDRVHDRRRRAGRAARADRSIPSSPTCCGTGTSPDSRRRWRACASRSATTAGSTPPTSRPSRPRAGCPAPNRTCRTSRSAPTRAG